MPFVQFDINLFLYVNDEEEAEELEVEIQHFLERIDYFNEFREANAGVQGGGSGEA